MKDHNEEYFYIKKTDGEIYPTLQYARGGDFMELFDEIPLDVREIRIIS